MSFQPADRPVPPMARKRPAPNLVPRARHLQDRRSGTAPGTQPLPMDANQSAVTLTMLIVAVMAVAIAVDASSEPGLSVLAILVLGGLIAALAAWG